MTRRQPGPRPLEAHAAQFDDQHGLLRPRERNKTLTGLAGTAPVVGAAPAPAALGAA